jgi:hypothetical protein
LAAILSSGLQAHSDQPGGVFRNSDLVGHSDGRNGPLLVIAPANTLVFWVINQKMLINEVCSQNY